LYKFTSKLHHPLKTGITNVISRQCLSRTSPAQINSNMEYIIKGYSHELIHQTQHQEPKYRVFRKGTLYLEINISSPLTSLGHQNMYLTGNVIQRVHEAHSAMSFFIYIFIGAWVHVLWRNQRIWLIWSNQYLQTVVANITCFVSTVYSLSVSTYHYTIC
jgi:hypothetical protein